MSTVEGAGVPTLSVVMPNYNHGRYLRAALGAIVAQSLQPLEVLVIDDGSTDDSVAILREIEAKHAVVRVLVNERNMGPSATLNRGFREAAGQFINVTSADDQILPGFYEKTMTLLGRNAGAKLCIVDLAQFHAVTGRVRYLRPRLRREAGFVSAEEVKQCLARRRAHAYGGMTIFERETLLRFGGFPPELRWYGDWFTVLVLALRHGACYVPEALTTMRMLPGAYAAAGSKNAAVQDGLFRLIFDRLRSGDCADVGAAIAESGALCLLGSQILRVLTREAEYRRLLSARLVARLAANVPVTALGLNEATESPVGWVDRAVRGALGLDDRIQKYGVQLDRADG